LTFSHHAFRPALAVFWAALLLLAPGINAQAQTVRVSEIEIRGNQKINKESISTVISTKTGDELAPERLEADKRQIENLGWFRFVDHALQVMGNTARVVFLVTEFPVVQELEITGSTIFSDTQLRAGLKTRTGQVFNLVDWQADLNTVNKLYSDKGFLVRLTANHEQTDFPEKGKLKLEIGELKVGKVQIVWPQREIKDKDGKLLRTESQHKTKEYVVNRELVLKKGALYNDEQVAKDYRALTNLGFFETIDFKREVESDLSLTLIWTLTEKRTGQVSVGAGFSPRQQLIGRAELSDQNFRGKGQGVSVSGELGTLGGDGAPSIEFSFHEPWLTKKRTSMSVSVYNKLVYRFSRELQNLRNTDRRYFERRMGGQFSFGRPFGVPITTGFRVESVRTRDLPQGVGFPPQDGVVAAFNIGRTISTRDYVNNPTSGYILRFTTEQGHASLDRSRGASFDSSFFGKYIAEARRYVRLKPLKAKKEPEREQEAQKSQVLAFRLLMGQVSGNVPFFEQFFLGGAESLRGYLEDRFWGKSMFLASAEYRRPIVNRIVGVLFADVGDAFNSDTAFRRVGGAFGSRFNQHGGIRPQASLGLGLRVATPIGPIRLDIGFGAEGSRTHFSIGNTF
jgi:outer membrane protein insertion porin family